MKALIIGADMVNKGAELMLRTLVTEMRRRHPEIELGISPAIANYRLAADMELAELAVPLPNPGHRFRFPPPFFARHVFRGTRYRWGWRDVDIILDISGFAYTDEWGPSAARNLLRIGRDITARGGHVILFPQAFGPFARPGHARAMASATRHVALLFARDSQSREYLAAIEPACPVRLAPDITMAKGVEYYTPGNWVAIVPNIRLLDQGRERWGGQYLPILTKLLERLAPSQTVVKIIVHDQGRDDRRLAEAIARLRPGPPAELVVDSDPIRLKRMLASSRFVIGSRYHALVSGLSCNVPVLALGWSHKYEALLADYGLSRFSFAGPSDQIFRRLDELLDVDSYGALRKQLEARNRASERDLAEMWEAVDRFLTTISAESP